MQDWPVDTGADVHAMTNSCGTDMESPTLKPTTVKLRGATGERVEHASEKTIL